MIFDILQRHFILNTSVNYSDQIGTGGGLV